MSNTTLRYILSAALAMLVLAVYGRLAGAGFITLDDNIYVYENTHVQQGLTPDSVKWAFSNTDVSMWIPVTWLSLEADHSLFGLNPAGFHLTNLFLHIANTILLFLLLLRITGGLWKSAAVAVLFAAHPLQVESVAWITERKDVLSTLFVFLSLLAYVSWTRKRDILPYALALLAFAAALMAKPMAATVPLVMLMLDWWPLGRFRLKQSKKGKTDSEPDILKRSIPLLIEKIPFFALSAAITLVTMKAASGENGLMGINALSSGQRLGHALAGYATYLGRIVWPSHLAVFYPLDKALPAGEVLGSLVLVVFLTVAAIRTWRGFPFLLFGWAWFVIMLLPVSGIFQAGSQETADRFTYMPIIGIFIILVWGIEHLLHKFPWQKTAAALISIVVLGAFSVASAVQARYWNDSISIFRHTIAVTSNNWIAYNSLGIGMENNGDTEGAADQYRAAIQYNPDFYFAHYNLGRILLAQERYPEAAGEFSAVLQVRPDLAAANEYLGIALERQGRGNEAVSWYEKAVKFDPDLADAHYLLGNLYAEQGRIPEAMTQFDAALTLNPDYPEALNSKANVLEYQGNFQEAADLYARALSFRPDSAVLHRSLAGALEKLGRTQEAEIHVKEAERLEGK